jgi:predicted lysophospholipase L1 biosynthesis ABC-type transport system permease subunit
MDVIGITDLPYSPFIVGLPMFLLAIIQHLRLFRTQPEQGALPANAALCHLGLTIIAVVYVLIFMWQN